MSIWDYANPKKFFDTTTPLMPLIWGVAGGLFSVGLIWGFFFTEDDFRMGSTIKIFFIHVPSAMMAINAWGMMLIASLIWLVRRHHVSALAARAAAPIGATMTLIALITGAVWGQPMWGTWWVWDPRLTSFLILFLFYLGYMALWSAVENPDTAAEVTSLLCLVGSVFALLSRYAVYFWDQGLHQGASISVFKKQEVPASYLWPALIMGAAFIALFLALVLTGTRTQILRRRLGLLKARERSAA
ncbi:MAG: heme ABC transporter permease [Deltaproteobacteria bacterium]